MYFTVQQKWYFRLCPQFFVLKMIENPSYLFFLNDYRFEQAIMLGTHILFRAAPHLHQ